MFPVLYFGQNTQVNTQVNTSTEVNVVNERDLVLSEKSTKVFKEFPNDMSMYTDILIVDAVLKQSVITSMVDGVPKRENFYKSSKYTPYQIQNILSSTVFNIQNPHQMNKKSFKVNPKYLQDVKKEAYLYLYIRQTKGMGDDTNTSFMLRDYNRKLIYRATGVNVTLDEILEPLFNF